MQTLKEILPAVFGGMADPLLQKRSALVREWPGIVGEKIAGHTSPLLSKSGDVIICVDQPVLAFELSQKYGKAILKKIKTVLGNEEVTSLRFRVGQIR